MRYARGEKPRCHPNLEVLSSFYVLTYTVRYNGRQPSQPTCQKSSRCALESPFNRQPDYPLSAYAGSL